MDYADSAAKWRDDEEVLALLGASLAMHPTTIEVRLPQQDLADQATAAWDRNDGEGALPGESSKERTSRHRAASLALIGLALRNGAVSTVTTSLYLSTCAGWRMRWKRPTSAA